MRLHPAVNRQTIVERPSPQAVTKDQARFDTQRELPAQTSFAPCRGWLLVLNGRERGRDWRLIDGRNTMGASRNCTISIKGKFISRRHFTIETEGHGARLVDLQSTNGTFVNGIKVTRTDLHDGDCIQLGSVRMRYRQAGPLDEEPE